jgi:hypothetical protein
MLQQLERQCSGGAREGLSGRNRMGPARGAYVDDRTLTKKVVRHIQFRSEPETRDEALRRVIDARARSTEGSRRR